MFQTLLATSQDVASLKIVAASAGKDRNIQDARGAVVGSVINMAYPSNLYNRNN